MNNSFTDLLHRAENLCEELETETQQPRVDQTLAEVLQKTNELHARLKETENCNYEKEADKLLALSGVDLSSLKGKVNSLKIEESLDPNDKLTVTDVDGWLKRKAEDIILDLIEETNKNIFQTVEKRSLKNMFTSWDADKQQLLRILVHNEQNIDTQLPHNKLVSTELAAEALDSIELCYTQEILSYNQCSQLGKKNLLYRFQLLAEEKFSDGRVQQMWKVLQCMAQVAAPKPSADDVKKGRMTTEFVQQARSYLEQKYRKYIDNVIKRNRQQANLGAMSNLHNIISFFVRINFQQCQAINELQNVHYGSPLWPHVYYSLRCGSISTAVQFLNDFKYINPDLLKLMSLKETQLGKQLFHSEQNLEIARLQAGLKYEYLEHVRSCNDPYKTAVFAIMLECAPTEYHADVTSTIDDFLFMQFCICSASELPTVDQIQAELQKKYDGKSVNELETTQLYFQSLVLIGYFELAIEFLAKSDAYWQHAVHMAIALNELSILAMPSSESDDKLEMCPLNVTQLISRHATRLLQTNIWAAFNYFYLLREFKHDSGKNLMLKCLADLLLKQRDNKMQQEIFGLPDSHNPWSYNSGFFARLPGIAYGKVDLAALVANELEICCKYEPAIEMYLIAQQLDKALSLLCILLTPLLHMPSEHSLRERLYKLTQRLGPVLAKDKLDLDLAALEYYKLLEQLLHFYDHYNADKCRLAGEVLNQTKLIPRNSDEVDLCLNRIKFLGPNVTKVMPNLMLAAMNLIYKEYLNINAANKNSSNKESQTLNQRSKALINLAATMPYRLPLDTNKELVRLEIQMQFK